MAKYSQEDKKAYLAYYKKNKGKKKTKTFSQWMKDKNTTARTKTVSKQARNSGLTYGELNKMR